MDLSLPEKILDTVKNIIYVSYNGLTGMLLAVLGVISVLSMWILFAKAGEYGWKSIIPLYNYYTLFKISLGKGMLFLVACVPILNIYYHFRLYVSLADAFGKNRTYGMLTAFFPAVFIPIIAFGSSTYSDPFKKHSIKYKVLNNELDKSI